VLAGLEGTEVLRETRNARSIGAFTTIELRAVVAAA